MNCTELAEELIRKMYILQKSKMQKHINDAMRGEILMLKHIASHDGVIPSEISVEMNTSAARIAAALNSLENKGLVTRRIDALDRRRVLVETTPAGRRRAEENTRFIMDIVETILDSLGEKDAKEYVRITAKLADMAYNHEP